MRLGADKTSGIWALFARKVMPTAVAALALVAAATAANADDQSTAHLW